ncbi:MAG: hypothetical protein AAFX03_09840 [Pseudomonadota bacterium]
MRALLKPGLAAMLIAAGACGSSDDRVRVGRAVDPGPRVTARADDPALGKWLCTTLRDWSGGSSSTETELELNPSGRMKVSHSVVDNDRNGTIAVELSGRGTWRRDGDGLTRETVELFIDQMTIDGETAAERVHVDLINRYRGRYFGVQTHEVLVDEPDALNLQREGVATTCIREGSEQR